MAVTLTDAMIKQIIAMTNLSEALGTESVTIQEAGGTYKYILISDLKKTFLAYNANLDLGANDITTTGDITADNIFLTASDIIKNLIMTESYSVVSVVYDADDYMTSAVITYTNGVAGTLSSIVYCDDGVESITYGYGVASYVVALTYDANGNVATVTLT